MKDKTRTAAGVPDNIFSAKDVLIPDLKDVRKKINHKEAALAYFIRLTEGGMDNKDSYQSKRERIVAAIDSYSDELAELDDLWDGINDRITDTQEELKKLHTKEKLAKKKPQVEAFLRAKAKIEALKAKMEGNADE